MLPAYASSAAAAAARSTSSSVLPLLLLLLLRPALALPRIPPAQQTLYSMIAKRNSIYVTSIFATAFAFSVGYDQATSAFYDQWNKGVRPPPAFLSASTRRGGSGGVGSVRIGKKGDCARRAAVQSKGERELVSLDPLSARRLARPTRTLLSLPSARQASLQPRLQPAHRPSAPHTSSLEHPKTDARLILAVLQKQWKESVPALSSHSLGT